MRTEWRCDDDGAVLPLHVPDHIGAEIVETARHNARVPMWCPWPLLTGWMVTGVGWAGDDRSGGRATVVACSGPAPLGEGPADVVLVAEEPGVGLGGRYAGSYGLDPGWALSEALETLPHAKVKAAGHPTPLWAVKSPSDRSAYVGEAKGLWIYAVAWPATAGYVLAEEVVLHDLTESLPAELVYGAPSPYLHGGA